MFFFAWKINYDIAVRYSDTNNTLFALRQIVVRIIAVAVISGHAISSGIWAYLLALFDGIMHYLETHYHYLLLIDSQNYYPPDELHHITEYHVFT